jgi:4'-phosphopantetheinyl transferase
MRRFPQGIFTLVYNDVRERPTFGEQAMQSGAESRPPAPGVHEVHIWYVFTERLTDPVLLAAYQGLLAPEEQARHQRFHFARDRHLFLVARALVRTTLSRYAAVPPEVWGFTPNRYGRPEISAPVGAPPLRFNLSHTSGLVACAVAWDREVGVDVEDVGRPGSHVHLARRFFAPSEAEHVESLSAEHQEERFFDFWTLKEAYIKARGMGLALPLADFAFRLEPAQSVRISFTGTIADDPTTWQFAQFRPSERHKLAVAVRRATGHDLTFLVRETIPLHPKSKGA